MNCFLLLDVLDPHGPTCVLKTMRTPGQISSGVTGDRAAGERQLEQAAWSAAAPARPLGDP